MKLFVNHFDKRVLEKKFSIFQNMDLSIFIEDFPKQQKDLSQINVLVLCEPNEYFGRHDRAIENKHLFDLIITWSDKVLNNCNNAIFLPFGSTWIKPEQYNKNRNKEFKVSHLQGKLLKTYGHSLRHEATKRKSEFKIPTNFYETYGDRFGNSRNLDKEYVFGDSQYGIVIENTSHRGYFTEKIVDCFLLKTVPLYWGCSNIGDYFDINGILKFDNVDDLIYITNTLTADFYDSKKEVIDKNWKLALKYEDYEQKIINVITKIFKYNNII